MKWNVLTVAFGGDRYKKGQNFLDKETKKCGVNHIKYDSVPDGYEYFSWKPYLILDAMEKLPDGDKIMCIDSLDIFHPDIFDFVDGSMEDDPCLLPLGNSINGQYTKRDCFVYMDCDDEHYWGSRQLEAGFTFWKVCDESKKILKEWLEYTLDEKINGEMTDFSGKPQIDGFEACRHDQSILTNMAIRDGLSVIDTDIRNLIECNADYWYERFSGGSVRPYRPIDQYLIEIKDTVDYMKEDTIDIIDSIILTVHNQEDIIKDVLEGIEKNTTGSYELILVIDGCTDGTEKVIVDYLDDSSLSSKVKFKYADNVFETKANNIGLLEAIGKYVIIVQDDMIIRENGWNQRMRKPFDSFDDVFAVTARTAHNYVFNSDSPYLGMKEDIDTGWCNIVEPCDEANRSNISRDVFAVRGTVNRGPLMINLEDLKKLNYLDESFCPQDMDDHDLMFRMHKELGKVCGCYWIDFDSEPSWGGTRKETGQPAPWLYKAQHKNSKIFHARYFDVLDKYRIVEDRKCES